jgi:hypothetical protein
MALGQPAPMKIMIDQKQLENVEYFNYLGSMITNDARIAMAKAAFNKKKNLFTSKLDLNLRKKLVKCYIWSIALYGAETWTLRKMDQTYLESFEMWCWRMEKISWTDRVRNEEVLHSQGGEEYPTYNKKKERLTGLVISCVETAF